MHNMLRPSSPTAAPRFGEIAWKGPQDATALAQALSKRQLLFVDVDTQTDFMCKPLEAGRGLPVKGAGSIIGKLGSLIKLANVQNIPVLQTVDSHLPNDPEFLKHSFPPHCVKGTRGWNKIQQTLFRNTPFTVSVDPLANDVPTKAQLQGFMKDGGALLFEKNAFSMTNYAAPIAPDDYTIVPNWKASKLIANLRDAGAKYAVVFGVATDYCVKEAIEGLKKLGITPVVVKDAIKEVAKNCQADPKDPVYSDVKSVTTAKLKKALSPSAIKKAASQPDVQLAV